MKRRMYCLFDKATRTHMNPLVFVNHGEAVRWLTTVVNKADDDNNVKLYPHQFILRFLGEFDDMSGKFENMLEDVMEATSVQTDVVKYTAKDLIEILDKRYGYEPDLVPPGGNGNAKRNEL